MSKYNYEITICGRVQGVGFRYFTKKKADEHNITGYVRNLKDRMVLIVAEGDEGDLNAFVDHIRLGPTMSRVIDSQISKSPYTGIFSGFEIRF